MPRGRGGSPTTERPGCAIPPVGPARTGRCPRSRRRTQGRTGRPRPASRTAAAPLPRRSPAPPPPGGRHGRPRPGGGRSPRTARSVPCPTPLSSATGAAPGTRRNAPPGPGTPSTPPLRTSTRATAQHRQGDLGAGVARRHPHPARPGEPVGHVERPVQRVHGPEVLHPDRTGDVQAVDQHRSQLRVRVVRTSTGTKSGSSTSRAVAAPTVGSASMASTNGSNHPGSTTVSLLTRATWSTPAPVAHPAVAPLGEAQVGTVLDHGHAGEGGPKLLQGPVDGPVVHQHDLQQLRRVVGGPERVEAPTRVPGRVPVEDHDPDPGQVRFRHRHHRRGHHSALTSAPPMDTHA